MPTKDCPPTPSTMTFNSTTITANASHDDATVWGLCSVSNALADPFIVGIQVAQTVALGTLLVLVCITLFHCRQQARVAAATQAKATNEEVASLSNRLFDLKARITEVGDAVEKHANERGRSIGDSNGGWSAKRSSGLDLWESNVLKRLRGV